MKITLAIIFTLAALTNTAWAQESVEPTDDTERAFQLSDEGMAAFQDGRYADAAKAFAAAWELAGDSALRKNEALAWFRAGECDAAVSAGNKFLLDQSVIDADRADIHAVISNCKVDFAHRAIRAGDLDLAATMLDEADPIADAVARDRIASARVELAGARRAAEEAKPAPEPEVRTVYVPQPKADPYRALGLSLIGGGGAVIVGTAIYHLVAYSWQSRFFALENGSERGDQATFDSLRKRVHTARVLVPILYSVGVATAGTGVVFTFFLPLDGASTARGDGPAIGIAGRF